MEILHTFISQVGAKLIFPSLVVAGSEVLLQC